MWKRPFVGLAAEWDHTSAVDIGDKPESVHISPFEAPRRGCPLAIRHWNV